MRESSVVKSLPSQLHCCMSEANMAAPLSLAMFLTKLISTPCRESGRRQQRSKGFITIIHDSIVSCGPSAGI